MLTTMLQFSGGKDSLACLYLNKERWEDEDFCVGWLNSGAAYPETTELMEGWKKKILNFFEVKGDQPSVQAEWGIPTDILPIKFTAFGREIGLEPPYLLQDYGSCCARSIWFPMAEAVKGLGITTIIRGQRDGESRRSPIRDNQVVEGITYRFPINDWSVEQVFSYLSSVGAEIPPYYEGEPTGRDCWNCTAYLDEQGTRFSRLNPGQQGVMNQRFQLIRYAVLEELQRVNQALTQMEKHNG
jgi:phosphoadenosine phosphosulfate reductase